MEEILKVKGVSFAYPDGKEVLHAIDFSLWEGDFAILFGASGSGKTTLLRQIKTVLRPHGIGEGDIYFAGENIEKMTDMEQASEIGYLLQNPDTQIVTHKVETELAFGLENLGTSPEEMTRRIGEMVDYFGMASWYHKEVSQLSGGQKQILNLASIMVMHPKMLLLDEPTAWLDPVSATEFMDILVRLNQELGLTILMTEHRLDRVMQTDVKLLFMKNGTLRAQGDVVQVATELWSQKDDMFAALPLAVRCFYETKGKEGECPVTLTQGRRWIRQAKLSTMKFDTTEKIDKKCAISVKKIAFRYDKEYPDVICDLSIALLQGRIHVLVGANGSGKSTLLALLSGVKKPYKGRIKTEGRVVYLPQNVRYLFTEELVGKEVSEAACAAFGIEDKRGAHPYDLSGGEMEKLALAKAWESDGDIVLMDEPTKGLDVCDKRNLVDKCRQMTEKGKTVLIVTHDMDFASEVAEDISLLFDGRIVYGGDAKNFFMQNMFYTTEARRLTRGILDGVTQKEELIQLCRKK